MVMFPQGDDTEVMVKHLKSLKRIETVDVEMCFSANASSLDGARLRLSFVQRLQMR